MDSQKTILTPAAARRLAFAGEQLPPGTPSAADIAAAERRYILPVVGGPLYERLAAGGYASFAEEYLAPAAALFTRLVVQSRLDVRTDRCGTTAPRSSWSQPAGGAELRALRRSLRREARTLLRRASERLAARPDEFPEYDPRADIFNRCSTDGGFVQIR